MYPVQRSGPRIGLRELTVDDVDAVSAVYGDPRATEHMSFEPLTREQTGQFVARCVAAATTEPRTEYASAVVAPPSDRLIGTARLALDSHQQQAATMGFALHPDSWGAGHGTETVHLLLALAFEELSLHRVWGARSPLNTASARTMAAAGMTEEGTIRGHIQKAGRWRDSVVHAVLADEWKPRRS
ncbi:GNAT family protein [Streptomyces sp. RG80]|uniref:GNAT family N-acetyltransferase n=1 Tax=Streptomyces sp. RG80 TaxID=3157340 RepID=UPI00338E15BF